MSDHGTTHHVLNLLKNNLACWEDAEEKSQRGSGARVSTTEEESEGENRRKKCDLHPERDYFKRRSVSSAVGDGN